MCLESGTHSQPQGVRRRQTCRNHRSPQRVAVGALVAGNTVSGQAAFNLAGIYVYGGAASAVAKNQP